MVISKFERDGNVVVAINGVIIKEISLYDDFAHTKAKQFVADLRRNPTTANKLLKEAKEKK